jgi:HSP20 family protein
MALFRGDPLLAELQSMGEDVDRAFGRLLANQSPGTRGWLPPADIYETDDDVVIELDAPGCHSEDLAVEAIDGQLVIVGERQPAEQATRVLTVHLRKPEETKPKRITINHDRKELTQNT